MARKPKGTIGVCEVKKGKDVPEVLDSFDDRDKALKDLVKRRSLLEGMQKYNLMTLPLGNKGEPLMPPGAAVRYYEAGVAEPTVPKRKKGQKDDDETIAE